ncbi:VOC family protein [Nocardioides speluncae]|uniref:VOC family protein n=1 Tax=Nocardioides speluncae TaxID=2670337 RepID=UPI000D6A00CC|nr:VOC family protein [Nocardioides speluncae]
MITHIGTAMFYVSDQEESLRFYRDILGFSVVTDQDMGGGARWLEVAPPGGSTTIALHDAAADGKLPGDGAYLTFACDDVARTVDELRAKGAQVTDPDEQPWGTFAFVEGPDGHRVQIHRK